MNNQLRKIINTAKNVLRSNTTNMTFGIIEDGITVDALSVNQELINGSNQKFQQYVEFVQVVSGFSLGSIVLFEYPVIKDYQNLLDFQPDWETNWLCVGKIMSEPLGINKMDGNVYWFSEIPYSDEGLCLGTFNEFLEEYVFGNKYSEIIPWVDEDDWYQFIIKHGLIFEGENNDNE
ncbi:hypothetical protein [Paenibacillus glacialis]|uniref:Knr4/Smi1-like domain-containing protein n=1 Tax=Paenibacillus glacialis TaxID=494026 RepID=A0A168I4F1_9BACL|nr:hypothetical protein [Paenibacillus glacialis]OAB38856.1 hypothetical protein PGLA_19565 [Paenibacillus glacialis]